MATRPGGLYDDYGLGLGRYRFLAAQVIGHHGSGAPLRSGLLSSTPSSPTPSTLEGWTVAHCSRRSCARSCRRPPHTTDHAGLTGHGVKDLWQHRSHYVADSRWWPPFCLVVDWVASAILVLLIAVGVDFHH
jgi:hypothetical protein